MSRRKEPDPPVNVQIVHADGTATPLEMVYVGWVRRSHQWQVVTAAPFRPFDGDRLHADKIPPKTTIIMEMRQPG